MRGYKSKRMPPPILSIEMADFSVDLVASSRAHVAFLRRVHAAGVSLQRPSAESVRRYRELWLPLLASRATAELALAEDLVPPLDIAWLWHTHRLAPRAYRRACIELLGASDALDAPRCAFASQSADDVDAGIAPGAAATRARWAALHEDEPFFLPAAGAARACDEREGVIAGFDVAASAERQAGFLWQVSGERFGEEAFVEEGVARYAKFLRLIAMSGRGAFVVPTYQIDLFWHTHMLASAAAYERDGAALAGGAAPDHDDSVDDRSTPETKLNASTATTRKLWADAFGEPFEVRGGMYRGEPPAEFWSREWRPESGDERRRLPGALSLLRFRLVREALGLDKNRAALGGAPPSAEGGGDGLAIAMDVAANLEPTDDNDHEVVVAVAASPRDLDIAVTFANETVWGVDLSLLATLPKFIEPTFCTPECKGQAANPRKENYVFGQPDAKDGGAAKPWGYYRIDTLNADVIVRAKLWLMIGRLKKVLAHQKGDAPPSCCGAKPKKPAHPIDETVSQIEAKIAALQVIVDKVAPYKVVKAGGKVEGAASCGGAFLSAGAAGGCGAGACGGEGGAGCGAGDYERKCQAKTFNKAMADSSPRNKKSAIPGM